MGAREFFESLPERIQRGAQVNTAFGQPIAAEGKTIVPVARVGYGFGGGVGTFKESEGPEPVEKGGGGGGGGAGVLPIGVVEITPLHTRFIPFADHRKAVGALLVGLLLGLWLGAGRPRS